MNSKQKLSIEDLKCIKNPIIFCRYSDDDYMIKIRILYPSGECEYMWLEPYMGGFRRSCFAYNTLDATINAMIDYDCDCFTEYILIDELD